MSLIFRNLGQIPEETAHVLQNLVSAKGLKLLKHLVRVAMYFRSTFVESCNQIHFWKAETSLKPKTNVSI